VGVSYGRNQWVYLIEVERLNVGDSVGNHLQRRVFLSLYPALLPAVLNHGCRSVSELFSGEGDEVVEEMWRVRVSDHHSFSRVPDRHPSLTFSLPRIVLYCVRWFVTSPVTSR